MAAAEHSRDNQDPFDLVRFAAAQEGVYHDALAEIRAGNKQSHWMWFIFPQIDGLGSSSTAKHYAIKSPEEARQYLAHPVLHYCASRLFFLICSPNIPFSQSLFVKYPAR